MNEAPMIRHGIGKWLRSSTGLTAGAAGGSTGDIAGRSTERAAGRSAGGDAGVATSAFCWQPANNNAGSHRMRRKKSGFRMAGLFQIRLLTELDAVCPSEVPGRLFSLT
jgi:hypothetical protein